MDQGAIRKICKEVYRRFPELDGQTPKVQARAVPDGKSDDNGKTYLLTFHAEALTSSHKVINRWVRVVADERGKILKITTSR